MNVVKAPAALWGPRPWIFLAGSIEMGAAVDWQLQVTDALGAYPGTLLNPRRDDQDASWVQTLDSFQFVEQVEWELAAMEAADVILMYFAPGTRSPITLLEFGLWARYPKLVVCCPEGFWRKGNVDVTARFYGGRVVGTLNDLVAAAGFCP